MSRTSPFRARWSAIVAIAVATLSAAPPALQAQAPGPTFIEGGWIFDVHSGQFTRNTGLYVAGGKFLSVTGPAPADAQDAMRSIQLGEDDYVLPGMFDVHAHYNVNLDGSERRDETVVNPVVFLANGVTATFPGGEYDPEPMAEMRQRIDRGEQPGPRILSSGPYFGRTRPGWNQAMTREELYREVDYWAGRNVAGFKAKGIGRDHLQWLIERAHLHGLPVAAHLGSEREGTVNAADAILLGVDRVEHILGGPALSPDSGAYQMWNKVEVDSPEFREIVDLFLRHRVFFNPTITAPVYLTVMTDKEGFDYWIDDRQFVSPEVQATVRSRPERNLNPLMDDLYWTMRRTTKAFYDAGGGDLITIGTDLPSTGDYLAGFSYHRELHTLVMAGIPPAAVLKAATLNGARAMSMSDRLGSIEAGKFADLVVVRGNPLQDIQNTRNVRMVMKAGETYDPGDLLKSVEGKMTQPADTRGEGGPGR